MAPVNCICTRPFEDERRIRRVDQENCNGVSVLLGFDDFEVAEILHRVFSDEVTVFGVIVVENGPDVGATGFTGIIYPHGEGPSARIADSDNILQHFERLSRIRRYELFLELDSF